MFNNYTPAINSLQKDVVSLHCATCLLDWAWGLKLEDKLGGTGRDRAGSVAQGGDGFFPLEKKKKKENGAGALLLLAAAKATSQQQVWTQRRSVTAWQDTNSKPPITICKTHENLWMFFCIRSCLLSKRDLVKWSWMIWPHGGKMWPVSEFSGTRYHNPVWFYIHCWILFLHATPLSPKINIYILSFIGRLAHLFLALLTSSSAGCHLALSHE